MKIATLEAIHTDGKPGCLVPFDIENIEKQLNIKFNCSRMFYLSDLSSEKGRGSHANKYINELVICCQGSYSMTLTDKHGSIQNNIHQHQVVFVPKNTWIDFNNFDNCVLFVLIEDISHTDTHDKIYDFEEFQLYISN